MLNAIARPFGQFLMFLYEWVGNYGLALVLFAIAVRGIMLPFQMKSKRGMMRQARLQPKVAELQKKHGANKTKLNEEMAKMYKEEGANPASGCLWSLLPFPIMLALFLVIREPLTMMMGVAANLLADANPAENIPIGAILAQLKSMGFESTVQPYYIQVDQAQFISANFSKFADLSSALRPLDFSMGILNLGAQPQWNFLWTTDWSNVTIWLPGFLLFLIPLLSGGSQFVASGINRKMNPTVTPEGQGKSMQTMMMLMPLMSVYFAFITPAALGFYWMIGTVLQIAQDVWLTKRFTRILDAEDAVRNEERKKKEAEIEAKRLETERKKAEGLVERNPNTSKRRKQKIDKQEQLGRAADWEKKNAPPEEKFEPSRVGNRHYARGRAYDPDRYTRTPGAALSVGSGELRDWDAPIDEDESSVLEDGGSDLDAGDDDSWEVEWTFEDDEPEDNADGEDDAGQDSGGSDGGYPGEINPDGPPTVRFDTTRFDDDT